MRKTIATCALLAAVSVASSASAQSSIRSVERDGVIESYVAYIGEDDLYNSSGVRLRRPWEIIRQDRANVHRFGIRQRGDEMDSFFGSQANRERLEAMLASGSITREASRAIVNGGVWIEVEVIGRGGTGRAVRVTVQ